MTQQTPTQVAPPQVDRVRRAVEEVVGHALELVDEVAAAVQPVLEAEPAPRRADLAVVEPVVRPAVGDADHPVQGAGFVAAVGLLRDAQWWLEWFAADADGRVQRLVTQSEPHAIGFYDYESLPWYAVPRDTGKRHVTGPYLDYVCTEEYTLTISTPVMAGDRFAGIAGADIAVRHAEAHLLPALCASDTGLAVVNADGRILSSNSGRHVCGDLLADPARGKRPTWPVAGLPLSVVTLDD